MFMYVYVYMYIYIYVCVCVCVCVYGGVSFVYNPDRCTGEAPRKEGYPSMAPGRDPPRKFPKEFPASGREFLGPKSARPPPGEKNAPAFGRGRLVVSEYAGKKRFLHRKMTIF